MSFDEERLNICKECKHSNQTQFGEMCNICGCFLQVKTKIPFFHCPISKW